jgi:hypothetical protein
VLAERKAGAKTAVAAAVKPEAPVAPAPAPAPAAAPVPPPTPGDVLYPLDAERRRRVIEIEGVIARLDQDFRRLKSHGLADDLLQQRCRKLIENARECISTHHTGTTDIRILDIALDNLGKTWRQIRSLLQMHDRL